MNNALIEQKSWWKRNWKWFIPVSGMILISIALFFFSGMNSIATNLAQAYADTELYENAIQKAKSDKRVTDLIGAIQPIDKLAILEGQVEYTNNHKTVNSTIRIIGAKGKAQMDISANRINEAWNYNKINIRIKNPPENKQTIELLNEE